MVTLKLAASLDGKIATVSGDSHWISGEESRKMVHRLRNRLDAVLVGSGTVMTDDPQLTCRIAGGRNPWRIVLDRRLRVSPSAQLFHQRDPEKTIILTSQRAGVGKAKVLTARGAKILRFGERNGKIPWNALLRRLARMEIQSVLIEGGATTAASALRDKVVDKVLFFYAPIIIGGDGRVMVETLETERIKQSLRLTRLQTLRSGTDIAVSGYL